MLWFNILLTLAVCGAMFELVRRTFHFADAPDDPQDERTLGVVAAGLTLILLGITAIYLPYTLVCLCAGCLLCLSLVVLIAGEHNKETTDEDAAPLEAFLNEHGWGTL